MIQESPSFGRIVDNEHTYWNGKIRGLESDSSKIVRVDTSPKRDIGSYTAGEWLVDELEQDYGIRIPQRYTYGEKGTYDGKPVFYSLVEKVHGLSIVSSKLSDEQIQAMLPEIDTTFASLTTYLADRFTYGGAYLNDIKARQFVYGNTEMDSTSHVYFVDIDPYFSIYDPSNPQWRGNRHFLGIYLTVFSNEVAALEISFEKEMKKTVAGMKELFSSIPSTTPNYDTWIKSHLDHFNRSFEERTGISQLF